LLGPQIFSLVKEKRVGDFIMLVRVT